MDSPTSNVAEMTAGLVGAHCEAVLVFSTRRGVLLGAHGHPFVPVLRIGREDDPNADLALGNIRELDALLAAALAGEATCRSARSVAFQIARGRTGVSA